MDKLTALGYPPEDPQGPDEINTEIQNIYDKRYTEGYKDGVDKTTANAKIEYIYHKHKNGNGDEVTATKVYSTSNPGGCYRAAGHTHNAISRCAGGVCNITVTLTPESDDFNDGFVCTVTTRHSLCGQVSVKYHVPNQTPGTINTGSHEWWQCGSPTNTWVIGCGKNSSSIDKAIVTF